MQVLSNRVNEQQIGDQFGLAQGEPRGCSPAQMVQVVIVSDPGFSAIFLNRSV